MYLEHFGLTEYPFGLTPNTAFFLDQGAHREALNVLLVALRGGEGFIKITGEVGTGKTLLCRRLMNELREGFVTAYIPNPFLNPNGLRLALAQELGLALPANMGQQRVAQRLTERLLELAQAQTQVVLIIDEAQAMPDETLEAVRLLTNLETERRKLLQVVMFGQPELDQRLAAPYLRQLRQRVVFGHRLQPLPRPALEPYLQFRLQAAGYRGEFPFQPAALKRLWRASRGIPRLINILSHKCLLAAYGEGLHRIDGRHARRAIEDTDDARAPRRRVFRPALMALAFIGAAVALLSWRMSLG
jgi:MSHA biogenesis protein MshM